MLSQWVVELQRQWVAETTKVVGVKSPRPEVVEIVMSGGC